MTTGLLALKSDIESLQNEYELFALYNFNPEMISKLKVPAEELIPEECGL